MTREVNGFLLFGIWLSLLALLFAAAWRANFIGYCLAPTAFSPTPGSIVESGVGHRVGRSPHYYPHIVYRYSVNGRTYRSKQVTFGAWGFRERPPAQRYTDRYPVGRAVTVYYLPRFPSFAVLEPRNRGGTGAMLVFTTALFVIAITMIFWGRHSSRRAARHLLQS